MYLYPEAIKSKPTRPANQFLVYFKMNIHQIQTNYKLETQTLVAMKASELWQQLDQSQRQPYRDIYLQNLQQYKASYENWLNKWSLDERFVKEFKLKEREKKNKKRQKRLD